MNGFSNSILVDWKWIRNGTPAIINTGLSALAEATNVDVTIKLTGECADGGDTIHQLTWLVVEE